MVNYDTEKIEFVFDGTRQVWVALSKETQKVRIVEKEYIKKYFYSNYRDEFHRHEKTLFLELPTRELLFDPFKPEIWTKDTLDYQNLYIESKISQNAREKRKEDILSSESSLLFIKDYPHINALFENVLPIENERYYFLNWLSYIFATKKKTRTAIVIIGIQRTGKGVIYEQLIQYFFGENYTMTIENEHVKGRFTPTNIEQMLFVLANEVKADFRDGNNAYERLKMWISDPVMRIEQKRLNDREAPNFFNMLFYSNNSVPLQIQGSDGRYSVFKTKSRQLKNVAVEDFGITIEKFIENIQNERDEFLTRLACYSYNSELATTPMNTKIKETIYKASMTKIEILVDKIKILDEHFFIEEIGEIVEHMEDSDFEKIIKETKILSVYGDYNKINKELTLLNIFNEMKQDLMTQAILKNKIGFFYYRLFVSLTDNLTKIGTSFSSHFGCNAVAKRFNNTIEKVREVAEFQSKEYVNKFIPF